MSHLNELAKKRGIRQLYTETAVECVGDKKLNSSVHSLFAFETNSLEYYSRAAASLKLFQGYPFILPDERLARIIALTCPNFNNPDAIKQASHWQFTDIDLTPESLKIQEACQIFTKSISELHNQVVGKLASSKEWPELQSAMEISEHFEDNPKGCKQQKCRHDRNDEMVAAALEATNLDCFREDKEEFCIKNGI